MNKSGKINIKMPKNLLMGKLQLKLYPSPIAETLEGLESLLRIPHGCLEQTVASTYPNVILLHYLKAMKKDHTLLAQRAKANISKGYQRLLGFQSKDGGFSLYPGHEPQLIYTSYAGKILGDIAKVHYVDSKVLRAIKKNILRQSHKIWNTSRNLAFVAQTTETLLALKASKEQSRISWIIAKANASKDSYALGMCLNAIPLNKEYRLAVEKIAQRLSKMSHLYAKGRYWKCRQTLFRSYDLSAFVENTAQITRGLLRHKLHFALAQQGLKFLRYNRDYRGGWGTTSATVAAIKAIIQVSGDNASYKGSFFFSLRNVQMDLLVSHEQDKVYRVDLGTCLNGGDNHLKIHYAPKKGKLPVFYIQAISTYYLPWKNIPDNKNLRLHIDYGNMSFKTGDLIRANVNIHYSGIKPSSMLILDYKIPPGTMVDSRYLKTLVASRKIARYELSENNLVLYLDPIDPMQRRKVDILLKALWPGSCRIPISKVYDYYTPDICGYSANKQMVIY